MEIEILFKDDTAKAELIQKGDKVVGIKVTADIIEWPKKSGQDEDIVYTAKAGKTMFCPGCGEEKIRRAFGRHRTNRVGLQGWCIKCRAESRQLGRAKKLLEAENENE
jgi:hypothetical protein